MKKILFFVAVIAVGWLLFRWWYGPFIKAAQAIADGTIQAAKTIVNLKKEKLSPLGGSLEL